MKKVIACLSAVVLFSCLAPQVQAQGLLKKLKDKVNDKVNDLKGNNNSSSSSTSNSDNNSSAASNNSSGPVNRTGAGLTNTAPPDVLSNIAKAETASKDTNYSQVRYALQQAIMGVEIQLGRQILQSLPNTVDGLTKDTTKNVVSSTQFGWTNMTIQAVYSDGKDKQMTVMIGNIPMYASLVGMYFNNAYVQNNMMEKNPNIKQVQVKGEKAIIQFDESTGYSLIAQMGQSTVIAWQCVNFATEDEVMKAAESFDITGIKKLMGEQ
ncbi:hypothetical protein FC093_06860 [Ilyomonas limi]|uniref:DUF4251 domain-containing protein n=1 Tax=Ilyomonas limi TaxID=2575867 RepID=A0A4U3L609_9BACT|nr:hypothetical protein [Ilyomonas limi]TKK69794.1 hypothetical protein FC093_06860 [Ilyomonas limi]